MRIAWIGPPPSSGGGANGVATQVLLGLSRLGVEIDAYVGATSDGFPPELLEQPGLRFHHVTSNWQWDRWYSNTKLSQFITGQSARALVQARLTRMIAREHALRPYDFLYQFSQIELFAVRVLRRRLPRIVLHPATHAAGELAGLRSERELARQCEPAWRSAAVEAIMTARREVQRRDIKLADRVIAISRPFARHLVEDYGVQAGRISVVPNPIDPNRHDAREPGESPEQPLRLLFVSRIAVRKGLEMIIELSHELDRAGDRAHIDVIGAPSLWSDYTPLLRDLNPRTATFRGYMHAPEMAALYRTAGALLQPSHFEPFGLTVGEALAAGLPVVASDQVGAADGVDPRVCRTFRAGDQAGFTAAVREVMAAQLSPDGADIPALASEEARRLFDPAAVSQSILEVLSSGRPAAAKHELV